MFFISNHNNLISVFVHIQTFQNIFDHFCLVCSSTIQFASADFCEVPGKSKMIQDLSHIYFRFRGCYCENISFLLQLCQHVLNSRIYGIFKDSCHRIAFSVNFHRLFCGCLINLCILHKHLHKRRSYENLQFLKVRFRLSNSLQCILNRFRDTLSGFC